MTCGLTETPHICYITWILSNKVHELKPDFLLLSSSLINPDRDLPYFRCLCSGLNPSSKQATAESSWRERIRSSVVVCSQSMENRVTLSPPLLLYLSKKWNKTAHRTPPTDGKHSYWDERSSLPKKKVLHSFCDYGSLKNLHSVELLSLLVIRGFEVKP